MFAMFLAVVVAAEPAPPPRPATPAPDRLWHAVNELDEQLLAAEVAILRAELAAPRTAATTDEAFAALDRLHHRLREAIREMNPGRSAAALPVAYADSFHRPFIPLPLQEFRRALAAADIDLIRAEVGRLAGERGTPDVFDRISRLRVRLHELRDEVTDLRSPSVAPAPVAPAPAALPR